LFSPIDQARITGKTGKIQGAKTVKTQAIKEIKANEYIKNYLLKCKKSISDRLLMKGFSLFIE
jgi:hypothetical protein